MKIQRLLAAVLLAAATAVAVAQPANPPQTKTASLAARGLFDGDKLTPLAREKLTDFIINAIGLHVEVALIVPTGPWNLNGSGADERDLTPARLQAVKRFLSERGVDPKRIYVESRVDEKVKEPRLDVQVVVRPDPQ